MKKILGIILVIFFIIIGIITNNKLIEKKYEYNIESISECKYYIFCKDNKYGVIDKSANIIIEPEYTSIIIPNPEKDVFSCYDEEKSIILNSKKEEIFKQYEEVTPIKLKNVASTFNYEKSVLKYKKDNLYGLINYNGDIITKNIYDDIDNLTSVEGKFIVEKGGKKGIIDIKTNNLVEIKYDNIIADDYYNKESGYKKAGFIVSLRTDNGVKYGYINYKGKKILDVKYNSIYRITDQEDIYLIVSENGKYGLYKNNKNIIKNKFQEITYDDNMKLLIIKKNQKYGVSKLSGKEIIPVDKDDIEIRGIYIYEKNNGKNQVYDENGKKVDIKYSTNVFKTENNEYRIITILNNDITYYGIEKKDGTILVEKSYRYIEYLYGNYFIAKNDEGLLGIIDSTGKEILELKYDSVQRIKGKKMVQIIEKDTNITKIFSENMKEITSIKNANIIQEDDYCLIYNENEKIYIDNNGKKIDDISKLKTQNYPDLIGEYKKVQVTLDFVYYVIE